jgi:predicted nucleic acid-binding protein
VTIGELSERHRRVALDSNVFVYLLEAAEPWALAARLLLNLIEAGKVRGVLSVVGVAELCAGPARRGDMGLVERYVETLNSLPGLGIQPVTGEVAADAAVIRGMRGIGLADALHLACARAAGATAFVTNDRRLRGSSRLTVVYLDELVAA